MDMTMKKHDNSNHDNDETAAKKPRVIVVQQQATILVVTADACMGTTVSFLTHQERWNLATTCHAMCRVVEQYSRHALTSIIHHSADADFEDRLRQQALVRKSSSSDDNAGDATTAAAAAAATPTSSSRELPYRYLLEVAKTTYLYKLEMMHGTNGVSGKFAMSDDMIIMAGTQQCNRRPEEFDPQTWPPIYVYIWELVASSSSGEDKRLMRRIQIPAVKSEYSIDHVFFMSAAITDADDDDDDDDDDVWDEANDEDRRIVVCTNRRVLVFPLFFDKDEVGEESLLHSFSESTYIEAAATRDDRTVVLLEYKTGMDTHSTMRSFNIITGESSVLTRRKTPSHVDIPVILDARWMVLETGLLNVLDMEDDFRRIGSCRGGMMAFHRAPDCDQEYSCEPTFYAYDGMNLDTLETCASTGDIYRKESVRFREGDGGSYHGKVGNHVFVEKNRYAHLDKDSVKKPNIAVYSLPDGKLKRTLTLPEDHYPLSAYELIISR